MITDLSPEFITFFAIIGMATILTIILCLIIFLIEAFKSLKAKLKYNYAYKHRFDKAPTAKCYCKDCDCYNSESHKCNHFDGWRVADNWFCWYAEPKRYIEAE